MTLTLYMLQAYAPSGQRVKRQIYGRLDIGSIKWNMPNTETILEFIGRHVFFGLLLALGSFIYRLAVRFFKARTLAAEQQARLAQLQADKLEAERPLR